MENKNIKIKKLFRNQIFAKLSNVHFRAARVFEKKEFPEKKPGILVLSNISTNQVKTPTFSFCSGVVAL